MFLHLTSRSLLWWVMTLHLRFGSQPALRIQFSDYHVPTPQWAQGIQRLGTEKWPMTPQELWHESDLLKAWVGLVEEMGKLCRYLVPQLVIKTSLLGNKFITIGAYKRIGSTYTNFVWCYQQFYNWLSLIYVYIPSCPLSSNSGGMGLAHEGNDWGPNTVLASIATAMVCEEHNRCSVKVQWQLNIQSIG